MQTQRLAVFRTNIPKASASGNRENEPGGWPVVICENARKPEQSPNLYSIRRHGCFQSNSIETLPVAANRMLNPVLVALPLGFRIGIPICIIPICVPGRILHIAPGLFRFPLDLLRGTLNLRVGVARPFAYLALDAPGRIVNRAFHSVLVHRSTSVDIGLKFLRGTMPVPVLRLAVNRLLASSDNGPAARHQLQNQHHQRQHQQ
jgi:hypothetical protein